MNRTRGAVVCCATLFVAAGALAVSIGQIDDFQDGTTMGWIGGATETNIATGGPGGLGDRYLDITSVGAAGPGSRLATYNITQWAGDYLAEGIVAVEADVRNFSASSIDLRALLLFSPGGEFTSTVAITVPNDGLWHHISLGLTASDLTYVGGGTGVLDDTLSGLVRFLIRHQPGTPNGSGAGSAPAFAGTMGMDNIEAVAAPPSVPALQAPAATLLAMIVGGIGIGIMRRRRRHRLTDNQSHS